jgi:hypothetical protein
MQLKIFSMGLGSCWVNNLPNKSVVRKLFNIPVFYDPIALVVLGYPKNKEVRQIKRSLLLNDLISYNDFSFGSLEKNSSFFLLRKYLRLLYIHLPFVLRKLLQPVVRKFEKKKFD